MHKAYASYFVSYLLDNLKNLSNLNSIILFGSAAKEQATKESDIDIFIDLKKKNKKYENEINKLLSEYYKSKDALLFRAKGIDNKINIIIGEIDDWKDLKKSIESTGIVLYGSFQVSSVTGKKYVIIYWDKIEKNRGAFLNKIYGFKGKNKRYKGLIDDFSGKRIGKSSIMIPVEFTQDIARLLQKYKVNAKTIEVYK